MSKAKANPSVEMPYLEELPDQDFEGLIERAEWGVVNFSEIRPELLLLRQFSKQVASVDPKFLTNHMSSIFTSARNNIRNNLKELGKFSIAAANPQAERSRLVDNVRAVTLDVMTTAAPLLSAVTSLGGNPAYTAQLEKTRSDLLVQALVLLSQKAAARLGGG